MLGRVTTLRRLVDGLDSHLSRQQHVQSFSDDPACILRYAPTRASRAVHLSDGSTVQPGALVIDIHCWNERVPAMAEGGADLAWALKAAGGLRDSLRLLAAAVETRPDLAGACAVRAKVNFVGRGGSNASVTRIIHRMGFEDVDERAATWPARLNAGVHDALENVLIGALVWAHNPGALRRDKAIRERRPVWCSRARLLALHGAGPTTSRAAAAMDRALQRPPSL